MKDALADRPLAPASVAGMLLLFALIGAPHLLHLSPLLMAAYYLTLGWRALALRRPGVLPGRMLRVLLTLGGLLAVAWSVAGQLDGRALGVGLLTVMAGLKSLEVRSRRDLYVTVFLGCFLLATQFLFERSLWLSLYLAPLLVGLLALLAYSNRVRPPSWRRAMGEAGWLMVAGLPMAVLLFVLFPRLAGPLWAVSAPAAGVTGLSDRISPGSVSRLSRSRAVAFRVSFPGERPPNEQLYWRGPVFWDTDGRNWDAGVPVGGAGEPEGGEDTYTQEIILEPTNQSWLFALDRPLDAPPGARLSGDGQVLAQAPVNERRHYRVDSRLGASEPRPGNFDRRRALAVPADAVTDRMRALVAGWTASGDAPAVVAAALTHFREQPFVYTLAPPPLPGNPVDGFLFDTRRGFCEHYASSFTVLMRLAGIPTRMVGGYQGGEWNPVGEHLVVRQSDAHAWAEVWLNGRWLRIDPTAAVAPERIERSIDPATGGEGAPITYQDADLGWLAGLVREGSWLIDTLEFGWQRWVVNYSDRTQAGLLERLGLGWLTGYRLGVAAVVAAGLAMLPLWWLLRRRDGAIADPALRAWRRLHAKLAAAGVPLAPSLAPSEVGRRAAERFPAQRGALQRIVGLYLAQRYGPRPGPLLARRLARAVRRLRLAA